MALLGCHRDHFMFTSAVQLPSASYFDYQGGQLSNGVGGGNSCIRSWSDLISKEILICSSDQKAAIVCHNFYLPYQPLYSGSKSPTTQTSNACKSHSSHFQSQCQGFPAELAQFGLCCIDFWPVARFKLKFPLPVSQEAVGVLLA